ncbi:HAD domain-containing protein [Butyrivibrio sp.]|uniref:HAD domain-containing protein n=1 Tax=Butyrivibrio sp. TaxID=28121 RepID=UPI0025C39C58|nr:HAD domain-containing protein [Butyrivibrio sp.]
MKMSFVVFLDIDGVLNTRTTCERTPSYYHGVDDSRAELLSKAMKTVGASGVVLTTDWKTLKEDDEDFIYLKRKLGKQGIYILGKTEEKRASDREEGVKDYLEEHPEIDEFVILDDNKFDFDRYDNLWERFLFTDGRGIENAVDLSGTPRVEAIVFLDAIKEADKP